MFSTLLAAMLLSGTPAAAAPDVQAEAKPVKQKRVCVKDEIGTGSRLAKRTCRMVPDRSAERTDGNADADQQGRAAGTD